MAEDIATLFDYSFPLIPIPRIPYGSLDIKDYLAKELPVIIEDSKLVGPALERWDLGYLVANLGDKSLYNVMQTKGHQKFKYSDQNKIKDLKGISEFVLETSTGEMTFLEFVKRIRLPQKDRDIFYYLQQPLNDTVGPNIFSDFRRFKWELVKELNGHMKWGELTNNMLLIGEPGNITPVHYDEQQNLFCQVRGKKRCLLFHPRHFDKLYPYPVYHPCDRQSKVDLRAPDLSLYPLASQLDGFEATKNIKVVMATGRIDILDPALLRPGRIYRKIETPNEDARIGILRIHSRKMNLTRGINLRKIASLMPGASGAEVKGVCTEAGMYALRERRVHVTQEDFEMAVSKVMQKDSKRNTSLRKLFK